LKFIWKFYLDEIRSSLGTSRKKLLSSVWTLEDNNVDMKLSVMSEPVSIEGQSGFMKGEMGEENLNEGEKELSIDIRNEKPSSSINSPEKDSRLEEVDLEPPSPLPKDIESSVFPVKGGYSFTLKIKPKYENKIRTKVVNLINKKLLPPSKNFTYYRKKEIGVWLLETEPTAQLYAQYLKDH